MANGSRAAGRSVTPPWASVAGIVLPIVGLALLLVRPELDLRWEHHPSHFWLVLVTAIASVVLAYLTNLAATRYRDAGLILVSLAFLASAGYCRERRPDHRELSLAVTTTARAVMRR